MTKLETTDDLESLVLNKTPLLDVRAPIEFAEGRLPNAVNMPILENDERAAVGTEYKRNGNAAAVALGHSLVSGEVKHQRVDQWCEWLMPRPEAVVMCFRGGMRSSYAQSWIAEQGLNRRRLDGGYKAMRRYLLEQFEKNSEQPWIVISGSTGSGKTNLLRDVPLPKLDLEDIAKHRGSAFGSIDEAQPSQASFENELGSELVRLSHFSRDKAWLIEDESRAIGARVLPAPIFFAICRSPFVIIDESVEARVERTFNEYIVESDLSGMHGEERARAKALSYAQAVQRISPKLGGLRTKEILSLIENAKTVEDHRAWVHRLVDEYYDPLYLGGLKKREGPLLFRGSATEVREYLSQRA